MKICEKLKICDRLNIRGKVFLSYLSVFAIVVILFGAVIHLFVRDVIKDNIQTELKKSADSIVNMVSTTASLSVKNYLLAIAEIHHDTAKRFYKQYTDGKITEAEAKALTREFMLRQKIGTTGYLFVVDIAEAPEHIRTAVHPQMEGKDVPHLDFLQKAALIKNGYLEYEWANPSDEHDRKKSMYVRLFEPWHWLIGASSYTSEFSELVPIDDFKDYISSIKFGQSGYIYIFNSKGDMILHPQLTGNVYDATDAKGWHFVQEICEQKNGNIAYTWKNPDEESYREKLAFFRYIPEYDWIVISSGYPEELFAPLQTAKQIIVGVSIVTLVLVVLASLWLSSMVSKPILKLTAATSKIGLGELDARIDINSNDEIGYLANAFNDMVENLKKTTTSIDLLNHEVAERKQAEQDVKLLNSQLGQTVAKLEETNAELKHFTYIASHDLREPLRKITAFGAILNNSLKDSLSEDDTENLSYMIDGASRMTQMVDGLLTYSRAGTSKAEQQDVDLNELVEGIEHLDLSVLIEEKNVAVKIPQPLPHILADTVQIRQLMQNYIANGIKYQPKDNAQPEITITAKPAADGMVKIQVADNGIGIKPENHQAVFAMFKRLHSRSEYEGTGIGLAVCKKLVERQGGQVGVESEPGKGSTFWFTAKYVSENADLTAPAETA